MKKFFFLFLIIALFAGCKKDKGDSGGGTQPKVSYINTANGSQWHYHVNNQSATPQESDYVLTSTSRDTSIQGKSFHVYSNSEGGSQYLNQTNSEYYQFDSIPAIGSPITQLFLKDNLSVNGTWTQSLTVTSPEFPVPIPITLNNTIADKGQKTVNGITYQNVIHVNTTVSTTVIPPSALQSSIDNYYAPNCGLIESTVVINLNYMGIVQNVNIHTTLTSSDLK